MYCASGKEESQQLGELLESFVGTLARQLDERLDKRLVRTFILSLKAILTLRHTKYGLLLSDRQKLIVELLLRHWCHRTGKRYREAAIPLYRLRSAASRLWHAYPPELGFISLNSG